jgi:hypothetical protein
MKRLFFAAALTFSAAPGLAQIYSDESGNDLSAEVRERLVAHINSFITATYDKPSAFELRAVRRAAIHTEGYCGEILLAGYEEWAALYVNFDAASVRIVSPSDTSWTAEDNRIYLKAFGCLD